VRALSSWSIHADGLSTVDGVSSAVSSNSCCRRPRMTLMTPPRPDPSGDSQPRHADHPSCNRAVRGSSPRVGSSVSGGCSGLHDQLGIDTRRSAASGSSSRIRHCGHAGRAWPQRSSGSRQCTSRSAGDRCYERRVAAGTCVMGGPLGSDAWPDVAEGRNADANPSNALVSSLGIIQTWLPLPSAILGSTCRYW
jgi:hypothetical protein